MVSFIRDSPLFLRGLLFVLLSYSSRDGHVARIVRHRTIHSIKNLTLGVALVPAPLSGADPSSVYHPGGSRLSPIPAQGGKPRGFFKISGGIGRGATAAT